MSVSRREMFSSMFGRTKEADVAPEPPPARKYLDGLQREVTEGSSDAEGHSALEVSENEPLPTPEVTSLSGRDAAPHAEIVGGPVVGSTRLDPLTVAFDRHVRPPGAIMPVSFMIRCVGCSDCIDACPHDAIVRVPPHEPGASPTVAIDPARRGCHLCADLPCVDSCKTGALEAVLPASITFGLATIDRSSCYTFRGPECGACGVCPLPVPALTFKRDRPQIDPDHCVGCGVCIDACVVFGKAIRFTR